MFLLASQSSGRLQVLRAAGIDPLVQPADVDENRLIEQAQSQRAAAGQAPLDPAQIVTLLAHSKAQAVWESLESETTAGMAGAPATPSAPVMPSKPAGGTRGQGTAASAPTGESAGQVPLAVVGCDSMLSIDGRVEGKPATPQEARERWLRMRGGQGELLTGHALVLTPEGARRSNTGAQAGQCLTGVSRALIRFGTPTEAEIDAYVASGEPLWCAGAFAIDGLGGAFIEGIDGDPSGVIGISLPLLRGLFAQCGLLWTDLWRQQ